MHAPVDGTPRGDVLVRTPSQSPVVTSGDPVSRLPKYCIWETARDFGVVATPRSAETFQSPFGGPAGVTRERMATWLLRVGFSLAVLGMALEVVSYLIEGPMPSGLEVLQIPLGVLSIVIAIVGLGLAIAGYGLAGGS